MGFPNRDQQWQPGQSGNPAGRPTDLQRFNEAERERLQDVEAEAFRSLELTHGLSIATAHATISKLHRHAADTGEPLTLQGAQLLRLLTDLIVQAQELEIRRHLVMGKVGRGGKR